MASKIILSVLLMAVVTIFFFPHRPLAHGWMAPNHEASRSNPTPRGKLAISSGQLLFTEFCAHCHGGDGRGLPATTTQLSRDTPNLPQRLLGHSDGDFHWKIRTGRGEMPAFEKDLSENEIWEIIHFIRSLAD